jgi:hypothetical protein
MPSDPSSARSRAACPRLPQRGLARLASAALACTLAFGAAPAQAATAPDSNEIERLYNEGADRNSAKNYSGAAESWTELLVLLPEQSANQSTRENVLLNVLDAYMNAYNGMRKADNTKDITYLRSAQRVLAQYLGAFQSAYGRGKGVSAQVQQKANELDELVKKAEEEARGTGTTTTPPEDDDGKGKDDGTKDDPPPPPPIQLPPENNGIGLIAGGAVLIGVGLGSLALVIVGGVNGPKWEKEFETKDSQVSDACGATPEDQCSMSTPGVSDLIEDRDYAEKKGKQANSLTIAGAVIAPLFVAGGAVMLAFGIKRNREAKAAARPTARFSPNVGRNYAGFVIQGRF